MMKLSVLKAIACALVVVMPVTVAVRTPAQNTETKPKVSTEQINDERLAVYHAFINSWSYKDASDKYLVTETIPLAQDWSGNPAACLKGFEMEAMDAGVVHRFTEADKLKIGGDRLQLYDRTGAIAKAKEEDRINSDMNRSAMTRVAMSEEHKRILTFSEIQFDKKHEHAILHYIYLCNPGNLCLNFDTLILAKSDGGWKKAGTCDP
jgi:hypothetical protein